MVHMAEFWMFYLVAGSSSHLLHVSFSSSFLLFPVLPFLHFPFFITTLNKAKKDFLKKNNPNKESKYHGTNTFLSKLLPAHHFFHFFHTLTTASLCSPCFLKF